MASINITNTPGNLSPSDFLAYIRGGNGPSKSSRFLVTISRPSGLENGSFGGFESELAYLCEAAEFPGRGFMSVDVQYHGPAFKIPYLSQYEDINLTFICRDAFLEREYFDNWQQLINPLNNYDFAYRNSYESNIRIFQISDVESDGGPKAQYQFTIQSAYPVLVNPQPVTWADDNFNRLVVAFTYKRWYREGLDKITSISYDLSSVVTDPNILPIETPRPTNNIIEGNQVDRDNINNQVGPPPGAYQY